MFSSVTDPQLILVLDCELRARPLQWSLGVKPDLKKGNSKNNQSKRCKQRVVH